MATRVTLTWQDFYGSSVVVKFHVKATITDPADALLQDIIDAINAITHVINLKVELTRVASYAVTAGTGALVASDKAAVKVFDVDNDPHVFNIPAPIATGGSNVFQSDNYTLNKAAAPVVAFSSAISTHGRSAGGGALSVVQSGRRRQGKRLKN